MFEKLFCSKAVLRRHLEGPLSAARAAYLEELAAQGMARGTLLHRASYCLCIAVELQRWPPDHCFDEEEVSSLAAAWAAKRVAAGRASGTKWPETQFRFAATDFLRSLARLRFPPGRRAATTARWPTSSRRSKRGGGHQPLLAGRRDGKSRGSLNTSSSAVSRSPPSCQPTSTATSCTWPSGGVGTPCVPPPRCCVPGSPTVRSEVFCEQVSPTRSWSRTSTSRRACRPVLPGTRLAAC